MYLSTLARTGSVQVVAASCLAVTGRTFNCRTLKTAGSGVFPVVSSVCLRSSLGSPSVLACAIVGTGRQVQQLISLFSTLTSASCGNRVEFVWCCGVDDGTIVLMGRTTAEWFLWGAVGRTMVGLSEDVYHNMEQL